MTTPRLAAPKRPAPRAARRARAPRGEAAERRIALSAVERELLVRACARYQSALPSYLASARSELRILARVLRKLS